MAVDRDIATQILMNMPEEELLRVLQYGGEMMGGGPRYRGVEIAEKPKEYTQMPDTMGEDITSAALGLGATALTALIPGAQAFAPAVGAVVSEGSKAGLREATGSADQARKAMSERGGDYGEAQSSAAMRNIAKAGLTGAIGGAMGAAEEAGTGLASQAAANSTIPEAPPGIEFATPDTSLEMHPSLRGALSQIPLLGVDPPEPEPGYDWGAELDLPYYEMAPISDPPPIPARFKQKNLSEYQREGQDPRVAADRLAQQLENIAAMSDPRGVTTSRRMSESLQRTGGPLPGSEPSTFIPSLGAKPKRPPVDFSRPTAPPVQPPSAPSVPRGFEPSRPGMERFGIEQEPAGGFTSRAMGASTVNIFDPPPKFPMSEKDRATEDNLRWMLQEMEQEMDLRR